MSNYLRRLYFKISYNLWYWFYYKSKIYVTFNPFKMLRGYWSAREAFIFPMFKKTKMCPCPNMQNKWFVIYATDVDYKLKDDEYRHEGNPFIYVKFLWFEWWRSLGSKIGNRNSTSFYDMLYWEAVMEYGWDNHDLYSTFIGNMWTRNKECLDKHDGTIMMMLNHKAREKLIKEHGEEIDKLLEENVY